MEPVITTSMRQWKCHKTVRAEKIERIEVGAQVVTLHFAPAADGTPRSAMASHQWNVKHHPQPGMYLVSYEDGYTSCSPAAPFERGYTEIKGEPSCAS